MGLTQFSIDKLLAPYIQEGMEVVELGAQNLYGDWNYGAYASTYYQKKGLHYTCIDLNGENGALTLNLAQPVNLPSPFDIVTDFGTSEHVGYKRLDWDAVYNCWKTKHDLCKAGGYIISENPKTGNWPGHGYNYYTEEFYRQLAELNGYEILELGEVPAMGNTESGWNVYCVLRKLKPLPFIKKSAFKTLNLAGL